MIGQTGVSPPSPPPQKPWGWRLLLDGLGRNAWRIFWAGFALAIAVRLALVDLSAFLAAQDFQAILSLLLSIFAIGLSAAFYMKANEAAREFHRHVQDFTQSMSEAVGRMDERHGERLDALRDRHSSVQDHLTRLDDRLGLLVSTIESASFVQGDLLRVAESTKKEEGTGQAPRNEEIQEIVREAKERLATVQDTIDRIRSEQAAAERHELGHLLMGDASRKMRSLWSANAVRDMMVQHFARIIRDADIDVDHTDDEIPNFKMQVQRAIKDLPSQEHAWMEALGMVRDGGLSGIMPTKLASQLIDEARAKIQRGEV